MPSRVGTPKPLPDKPQIAEEPSEPKEEENAAQLSPEKRPSEGNGSPAPSIRTMELSSDVQTKLKKLDRLEAKYGDLLKAYRTAHARIQVIEPFEASLREYTPLTSINDPNAFIEYLGQVTAKGDMVLDEFKRVSAERDDYKKRAEQSEDIASQLRVEVAELKSASSEPHVAAAEEEKTEAEPVSKTEDMVKDPTSPTASLKSPVSATSRIPSFSLFSPRSKPTSSPPKESEEFFSYDSEVPKLEGELRERQQQVEDLKSQMEKLKGDLVVARESTEGMVVTLESASRELNELRDAKDKFDDVKASLEKRIEELENHTPPDNTQGHQDANDLEGLKNEKFAIEKELEKLRQQVEELEEAKSEMQKSLDTNRKDTEILNEKLAQKDSVVKDLEDTLAMYKSAERQAEKAKSEGEASEKKLGTMQEILDTVRSQLDSAEITVERLKEEIKTTQEKFAAQPSSKVFGFLNETSAASLPDLKTRDDVVDYLASNFGLRRDVPTPTSAGTPAASVAPSDAGTAQSSKKKNKKKKKGKGQQTTVEENKPDLPVKVSENLADVDEGDDRSTTIPSSHTTELTATIDSLRSEVQSRDANIDRLSGKIKDQEALEEEIETLRDDLLHQGEEHVEARDKLKTAEIERKSLGERIEGLGKELLESKKALAAGSASGAAHEKTLSELEELTSHSSTLQTDLKAAEQLSASRYKDLTDLKDVLSKAQPELKSLRTEVAELKSVKDDLKNKTGEMNRLEARHEDVKSELKGLGKRLGDKDSEIKELQAKVEQETSIRTRLEEELGVVRSELRIAESRKNEAVNSENEKTQELKKARQEVSGLRGRLAELEDQLSSHARQVSELKEEIGLKTALHSSSQSLVQSLRDQTHELTTQARESSTRAENLEEELAEAQRMLSERSREGQTMRMLLNQSESGLESRLREMKERMDAAVEERDRVEDEASVSQRRTMRELDEAKNKLREAQRNTKVAENEKEELEIKIKDWKRQRTDLEGSVERHGKEIEDLRKGMEGLREALNESERQGREMEAQKAELRRTGDEAKERVERLTKANKNLTEEVKALQSTGAAKKTRPGVDSGLQSSRTSIDSSRTRSPAPQRPTSRSETPSTATVGGGGGLSQGTVDYVYLKNVLLQFLEQKDKAHQRQLIPVLGMLLHFDRKDEQRWIGAIAGR